MVKLNIYLTPNSNPKHNAFAILSQPDAPSYYDPPSPTQQMDDDKTITPPGPQSTEGNKKLPGANTPNKHYGSYAKVTICSLTTASLTLRTNAPPSPRRTPTMQSMWQLILPMHNATNQPSGLPNVAEIRPTTWVLHLIKP
jgi:hypothetical protein